jgi:hypothetical protein
VKKMLESAEWPARIAGEGHLMIEEIIGFVASILFMTLIIHQWIWTPLRGLIRWIRERK